MAESANRTKKGGQELIGGLDVRVNRNYFGRQTESFEAKVDLPFLAGNTTEAERTPFPGVFVRAPVVEQILPVARGEHTEEHVREDTVNAPGRDPSKAPNMAVEVMATLPGRSRTLKQKIAAEAPDDETRDIIAVRQQNVFGTSFHPELTQDARIHIWWLKQVRGTLLNCKSKEAS